MLTLALSQVFYYIVLMWTPVTGGTDGLGNLPVLYLSEPLGWRLSKRPITRYFVIAALIFLAMLAIRHLLGLAPRPRDAGGQGQRDAGGRLRL